MKHLKTEIFRCPGCKTSSLLAENDKLRCPKCQAFYPAKEDRFSFIQVDETVVSDSLDRIKYFLKKYRRLYSLLVDIISPVYPQIGFDLRRILKEEIAGKDLVAINLGSGNTHLSDEVLNVDLLPYPSVNVVCAIENLPFQDSSIDYVINISVLEHVPNAQKAIEEIYRVLKPGGKLYCFIPFMQGFHASPYDFNRFTLEGMKVQFQKFEIRKIQAIGPTSAVLGLFQEWLALILSFGIRPLHTFFQLALMALTFPVKFLDFFLQRHPLAKNIACGFSIECIKTAPPKLPLGS